MILAFCIGNLNDQTATVEINFQANMIDLIAQGFDPDIHEMELRGEFNDWEGGDVLQLDESDETLYFITIEITCILPSAQRTGTPLLIKIYKKNYSVIWVESARTWSVTR